MMKNGLPCIQVLVMIYCAVMVSGCTVGPDYKTPVVPVVKTYNAKDEILPTEQHIAIGKQIQSDWWTLFTSQSLNEVIKQAIADNYEITTAKETLVAAQESLKAEQGNLFPQVSLDATAGNQKYGVALFGPINFMIPPFTYYEVGPSLSWTPDLFGKTRRSVERQKALAEYQADELDVAYITLTSDVVKEVLMIAATKAEIEAAEQIFVEDEKNLVLVQKAFWAGADTKVDILSSKSQLQSDKTLLPPLQQQLSIARHELAILLGKAPANWIPPDFELKDFALPKELPVSLPSELVRKRPDILAAEANLHAASAAVGIATANLYPSITLTGNTLQEALTPGALFNASSNAWSVAGTLSAPLFEGGKLTAEKRQAEHAYRATLAQYQQTILYAFGQVADTLTALQHDGEFIAAQQKAFDAANASLILARKSYQAGNANLLQIQDAERESAKARLDLIKAQSQRLIDTATLFAVLGGSPYPISHINQSQ